MTVEPHDQSPRDDPADVICIKWGTAYGPKDVNQLRRMVLKNTSLPVRFHCFTDDPAGLHPEVVTHPLPEMRVSPEDNKYAYRKEAGLCDDGLGGLTGRRVLFFDLDVVIVDGIDCFLTHPRDDGFYIIRDWNTKGDHVGQASCYSFVVGTLGFVKRDFEARPAEVVDEFFTASQAYLSSQVIKRYGKLNFWPPQWCRSFRFHCLPAGVLRRFVTAKIPPGARVIVFHGSPKIEDAMDGRWTEHKWTKRAHWIKRLLYKNCRPTPWIAHHLE